MFFARITGLIAPLLDVGQKASHTEQTRSPEEHAVPFGNIMKP